MNRRGNFTSFVQATPAKELPFGGKVLGIFCALLLVISMLPVSLAFPQQAKANELNPEFEVQYWAELEDFSSDSANSISLSTLDIEKNGGLYTNSDAIYKKGGSYNTITDGTNGTENEFGYFYLQNQPNENGKYAPKKTQTLTEIYRSETFSFYEAPNLDAFDIVSQSNSNYQLEKILVKQPGDTEWTTHAYDSAKNYIFTNNLSVEGDSTNIVIPIQETDKNNKTTIQLHYSQKKSTDLERSEASFFDYDITDGKVYGDFNTEDTLVNYSDEEVLTRNEDGSYSKKDGTKYTGQIYVKTINHDAIKTSDTTDEATIPSDTPMYGINSGNTAAGENVFYGFGNNNITNSIAANLYDGFFINQANSAGSFKEIGYTEEEAEKHNVFKGLSFGLMQSEGLSSNGLPLFSEGITGPDLFSNTDQTGKTCINGWQLGFKKIGDNYTLSSVFNGSNDNTPVLSELDTFSQYEDWTGNNSIYSNDFWPMDYSGTNEIMFGDGSDPKHKNEANGFLPSSDDGLNHNSYFGMTYSVDFEIQENYTGPLEYIFFGDDDMWVYLTEYTGDAPTAADYEKAKLVTDIGGVHSSVGSYVNIRNFLTDVDWDNGYDTHKYRLDFFYTERGSSGSSCYIEFTLPGVTKAAPQEYGSLTIDKDSFYIVDDNTKQDIEGTYNFSLTLTDANGNALQNFYRWSLYSSDTNQPVTDANNKEIIGVVGGGEKTSQLQIATNQYIKIDYLPLNTKYVTNFAVTETSSGNFDVMSSHNGEEMKESDSVSGAIGTQEGSVKNAVASFDNVYATSGLSISKEVTGNAGDENIEWPFNVSLTAPEGITLVSSFPCVITDTEGNETESTFTVDADGEGTVSLKHGETATITGLPVGTTYDVVEGAHDGYSSSAVFSDTEDTKTIEAGEIDTVTFTNNKNYISVTKVWNDGDNTFTGESIEVNLIDTCHPIIDEEDQSGEPSKNIVETVSLSADDNGEWKHEWTNLSGEHEWTVEEVTEIPGYTPSVEINNSNGLIVTLTNALQTGELEINKTVIGNAGDTDKDWTFQVELTNPSHVTLANSFTYDIKDAEGNIVTNDATLNLTDGIGILNLTHGQTAIISGLPIGTGYKVTEINAEDYTVTVTSGAAEGTISSTTDASMTFTNERNAVSVIKEWENDGNTFIGESIQVELIDTCHDANGNEITEGNTAEGKVIDTATISPNDEGAWYYQWTNTNTPELLGDHSWTVREVAVDGYTSNVIKVSEDGYDLSEDGSKIGTITQITNTIQTSNLAVSKTVGGNAGDTDKAWEFKITLKNSENVALKDAFPYEITAINETSEPEIDQPVVDSPVSDAPVVNEPTNNDSAFNDTANGSEGEEESDASAFARDADGNLVFTVSLKHNEQVVLSELPVGIEYSIDETEANEDGYITTINGMITLDGASKGTIAADETAKADYQNTCDIIFPNGPKTGDVILPIAAFAELALLSVIIALIARRNMRKE